ncbi:MAG: membrane protein insertion efficiency factor YidD [Opitutaceae bacterium]
MIRLYQRVFSPVLPALFGPTCGCRFAPSCSHFAAEAVLTHGAIRGGWLALWRLARCNPWHAGGFDPVPAPRCTRLSSPSATSES